MDNVQNKQKVGSIKKQARADLIFYCLMFAWPVIQFCVFWIGVNLKSFGLAFQRYDAYNNQWTWDAFNCIKEAGKYIFSTPWHKWWNSIVAYAFSTFIALPISIIIGFYIAKKQVGSSLFRIMIYLPGLISSIVFSVIWTQIAERVIPELFSKLFHKEIDGLLENADSRYWTIVIFGLLTGLGSRVLLYSNAISAVPQEEIEAANLEGAIGFKEIWYITIPHIYPTVTILLASGIGGIFLSDIGLYPYYGSGAPDEIQSFSYLMQIRTMAATRNLNEQARIVSINLITTLLTVPMVYLMKYIFKKFGPSEE